MVMAELDDVTALLTAPDPVPFDRTPRTRDDAVRWIECNTPSQGVARHLGMEVERTAYVHGGDALVLGMHLDLKV